MQADTPEEADQSMDDAFNRRDTAEIDRAVAEAPRSSTFDDATEDPFFEQDSFVDQDQDFEMANSND